MKISSAKRAKPGYRFYPNGPDRKTTFVALPREMVDPATTKNVKADWIRAVAFGDLAELINQMYTKGVEIFGLSEGRIRNNDLERTDGSRFESQEIVIEELKMKDFKKLMKTVAGTGEYDGEIVEPA